MRMADDDAAAAGRKPESVGRVGLEPTTQGL
jgi:hypothetical protein